MCQTTFAFLNLSCFSESSRLQSLSLPKQPPPPSQWFNFFPIKRKPHICWFLNLWKTCDKMTWKNAPRKQSSFETKWNPPTAWPGAARKKKIMDHQSTLHGKQSALDETAFKPLKQQSQRLTDHVWLGFSLEVGSHPARVPLSSWRPRATSMKIAEELSVPGGRTPG